jgi:hypothetical protein
MKDKKPFYLGQKITVNSILKRKSKSQLKKDGIGYLDTKYWQEEITKPIDVIVVGLRNISDGYTEWNDGIRLYTPVAYFKALFVVANINENPFYVKLKNQQ